MKISVGKSYVMRNGQTAFIEAFEPKHKEYSGTISYVSGLIVNSSWGPDGTNWEDIQWNLVKEVV